MNLSDILKDSNYKLTQFSIAEIRKFEKEIICKKDGKGSEVPYVVCVIRKKSVRLNSEEAVRQLYLRVLD